MKTVVLLGILTSLVASTGLAERNSLPEGTPVYRVGAGCTYPTIQQALDAVPAGASGSIRIRSGQYNESLLIGSRNIELLGGHADCASTTLTGYSTVSALGTGLPAMRVSALTGASGTTYSLYINRLDSTDGTGQSDAFPGGGISVITSAGYSVNIELDDAYVFSNTTAFHGGGIALVGDGTGTIVFLNNSRVYDNTVTSATGRGGGISCLGSYQLGLLGGSIHGNTVGTVGGSGRGGGISLEGCSLYWFAGPSASGPATLRNNTVHGRGGAIHASGGAQVDLVGAHLVIFGDPVSTRPLVIRDNTALGSSTEGLGGAFHAAGSGTRISIDRSWTQNNNAGRAGGAAYVSGGATINFLRSESTCHNPASCSRVFGNVAELIAGAGIAIGSGSQLNIQRTIVADNLVNQTADSILRVGDGALLELNDSLVHGITGTNYGLVNVSGTLNIRRSTIADLAPQTAVFFLSGPDTNLSIRDAIIHETGGNAMVNAAPGTAPIVETACTIWHDDALTELGLSAQTLVADPAFVNRTQGLFYLAPGSPAINYCFDIGQPADLEWRPRGLLHSGQPATHGPVDLGAYERPLLIFNDRFEN